MVSSLQRERWTALRYYYYHAGRSLIMNGNLYAGGINIGYAIEFSMKAGLREVVAEEEWEKNTILTKEHDIIKIFSECQAKHMFNEDVKISMIFRECQAKNVFNKAIDVSRELLEQININFQRYPSQIDKKFEENFAKGNASGNSSKWLNYYDDLIIQLDEYLLNWTSDLSISIIYNTIHSLESRLSIEILKKNAFALLKFDNYSALVRKNLPDNDDARKIIEDNISKGATFYWNPDCHNPDCNCKKVDYKYMENIAKSYSASSFELPRWKLSKNGNPELKIGDLTIN